MTDAFYGVFLDDLNRTWDVLKGGWHVNSSRQISWMPPSGILKLNFDGSFHISSRRGDIGGVMQVLG